MNDSPDIYTFHPDNQDDLLIPVSFFRNRECTGRLCRNCGENTGKPICTGHFDEINKRIPMVSVC